MCSSSAPTATPCPLPGPTQDGSAQTAAPEGADGDSLTDMVEQPAKVMRIGTMITSTARGGAGGASRRRQPHSAAEIHKSSVRELEQGLAPELREELERLTLPFTDDSVPTDAELRIAQAQLVGWLEGLFHGIQTALVRAADAARAQLEQMRQGALPPGMRHGSQRPDAVPDDGPAP
ncbi:DUF2587 domain-containing protein, partial [Rhodococcus hoagii]|nr:DUF2587 domain-containing protein [Prescottella equi]